MRPVKMNKISLLAAAMYAILEERRSTSPKRGTVREFEVLVNTTEFNISGEVITGTITINGQLSSRKFEVYFTTDEDLVIETTGQLTSYDKDEVTIQLKGDVTINFKEKSVTSIRRHVFKHTERCAWNWQAVKGTAVDIIGVITGVEYS